MKAIDIKNLAYYYVKDEGYILKDFNLTINKGEWVSILGHNGSGKSTLSKLIVGLLAKREGTIEVNGVFLEDNPYEIRKMVGIVFQNPDNQFVGSTVRDDIAFGLENKLIPREEMPILIDRFSEVVGMKEFLNKEPHNLSGGEKQRVAIAGVLAMDTDIIILDEATSMLDPKGRSEVMETINNLSNGEKTIITITHDLEEAVLSDRIVVLNKGEIVLDGKPLDVFKNEEIILEAGLDILPTMKLIKHLDKENIKNEEVRKLLWELSLEM